MGKYDKDRYMKELAIRYCVARGGIPFLEVVVPSASDLSDSVEVLTDIDVLGIEASGDGLHRTIYDCKTLNKMSSINRAFWAAGVMRYTSCEEAHVILKTRAVHNHRLSALVLGVDLHDEQSFVALGRTIDAAFPSDACYQESIDRWNAVVDCFSRHNWSMELFDLSRNIVPLTKTPWSTFRKLLAELRQVRGHFDPSKPAHLAIFFDILSASFVLWASMARDIRRFYEPTMNRPDFEKVLRYYLWGGKESYNIRQQMRDKSAGDEAPAAPIELPAWEQLVSFAGILVSAPQGLLDCAFACREISLRTATATVPAFDQRLSNLFKANTRIRQYAAALSDYLAAAGQLPKDIARSAQQTLFDA